ncbi:hypothetical protein UlMin_014640 [Ulmus minor]
MINKRPVGGEDSYEVACKLPRKIDCASELAPAVDIVPSENASRGSLTLDGEGDSNVNKSRDEGRFSSDSFDSSKETYEGPDNGVLWDNSSLIEADVRSETVSHLSFFPEFFEYGYHLKAVLQPDDIPASPVNSLPQKLVTIGPEHQAYVPEWDQQGSNSSDHLAVTNSLVEASHASGPGVTVDASEEKKMGTCVISMPQNEASSSNCCQVGESRNYCGCLDGGSVRCVRQHVMEAREKLMENVGVEKFEELGFCEMGEEVAKQWSEKEEHMFDEVVLANPQSLGKNFWDHLSVAFPSRTHKDLVSYYFNVLMLRKRAEQNRFDPLNIDSDNDEWQKSEFGIVEDDDDSLVKSPTNQDASAYYQGEHFEDFHEELEDVDNVDACKDGTNMVCGAGTDEDDVGDIYDGSGTDFNNSPGESGDIEINLTGKVPSSSREDYNVQDDSSTSFEYQQDKI